MSPSRRVLVVAFCSALALVALCAKLAAPGLFRRPPVAMAATASAAERPDGKIRFAVLGDSDSQSYHDTLMLGGPDMRGGAWRATTWQWTEVLARLRGDQVDLGAWGAWGSGKVRAYVDEAFGAPARTPRKDDYRYDFAVSGANCSQLLGHSQRQAVRLVELMDSESEAWRGGIVLIRIGINDLGDDAVLDALSHDRNAPEPNARIDACLAEIGKTVALIRSHHPDTHVVLVGVLSNADWSIKFDSWQSGAAIANIDAGLDRFDNGLRKLAAADRQQVVFLDDRAWFRGLWGARDEQGRPRYKTLRLPPGWAVTNTSGDDPHNAVLSDGHAGVVWNTLWTQHLIVALNTAFGMQLEPITDAQVLSFLQPSFAASSAANSAASSPGSTHAAAAPLTSTAAP